MRAIIILIIIGLSLSGWSQDWVPNSIVIVGQYDCPACQKALPQLALYVPKWQKQGLEVCYYSLDSLPQNYGDYPLPVIRLEKRWDDPLVKQLGTYATPTYYYVDGQGALALETATAIEMQLALLARQPQE